MKKYYGKALELKRKFHELDDPLMIVGALILLVIACKIWLPLFFMWLWLIIPSNSISQIKDYLGLNDDDSLDDAGDMR